MSYLNDGHPTLIELLAPEASNLFTDAAIVISFKEKRVTPVGIDGGGPNDTTTMRNVTYRTQQPKKLKTLTDMSATVSFDPAVLDPGGQNITGLVNINRPIRITFSDGSKLVFWGWLNSFVLGENAEGSQPEATITVLASNQNVAGDEVGPAFQAAA